MTAPTPDRYDRQSLTGLVQHWVDLDLRDATARAIAALGAAGNYDPARHSAAEDYPPLSIAEHLELLAIGVAIARSVTHSANVDAAIMAGAGVSQVAAVLGKPAEQARADYLAWIDGQADLRTRCPGLGLTADEAATRKAVVLGDSGPTSPVRGSSVTDDPDPYP